MIKSHYSARLAAVFAACLTATLTVSSDAAVYTISQSSGVFTPSYRGQSNTTYYGWGNGQWDGDLANDTLAGEYANPIPSINPGNLSGNLIAQANQVDIISGSNNIYSSVAGINSAGLTLTIPTHGTPGLDGFTTIIIQGKGLSGTVFGPQNTFGLDVFSFGDINGVAPTYTYGTNSGVQGQWFAKWELDGNESSYNVDIHGYASGAGVLSVTDMVVDTSFSTTGFADDSAIASPAPVPEPASVSLMMALACCAVAGTRRQRQRLA